MASRWRFWARTSEEEQVSSNERQQIIAVSIAVMTGVAIAVGTVYVVQLYRTAFENQRARLVEIVQSRARLIEAVARFDEEYSADDVPGGSWAATLMQLRHAHASFEGFGRTGEFTLARREGDEIVFLLTQRNDLKSPQPVPFRSEIAEPMRRALSGESGSMVGLDYRGVRVLAAYEPLAGLAVGIVAKIDLAEIRSPFITATFLSGLGAAGIILLGAFLLQVSVNPIILRSNRQGRDLAAASEALKRTTTLHRDTQQELRSERLLLDRFFEQESLGVALLDANLRFERVGSTLCRMLGYTTEELIGLTIPDVTHPDDVENSVRLAEKVLCGELSSFKLEKRYIKKSGEQMAGLLSVLCVTAEAEETPHALALIADVSKRKRAEEQLSTLAATLERRVAERTRELGQARLAALNMMADWERDHRAIRVLNVELERRVAERTRELEAANEELEAFSYSVSHDLKAPLRAIAGYSRMLQEAHAERLDEEGRRLLQVVLDNTEQMKQLIDDLLALSQLGRATLRPIRLDVGGLVRTVFEELRSETPERAVELKLSNLTAIHGDPTLIRQMFMNLISNALKFTGPRQKAVIEVGRRTQDGEDVYYVKDNGVGFDAQGADKLFGVFQRLHYADEFPGTGVGLAIVRRIVERHGGRVWAEGYLDEGATFHFTLPRHPEDGSPP